MRCEGRRPLVTTRDPEQGLAAVEEVYTIRGASTAPAGGFFLALSTAGAGPVTLERGRWEGCLVACRAEHTEVLRVGQVLEGVLAATSPRDRFPRRGPFLFPQRPYSSYWEAVDLLTVSLEAAVVEDQARVLLGADAFGLRFTGTRPVHEAMGRYWAGAITHLSRTVVEEELMSSPLLRAEVIRSVTTALLHTFPSSFLERLQAPVPEPGPGSGGVRRAVAFIDVHLAEPIGVAEIAAAARMSPRGLQAAFRRERGTTPLGYLRTARLAAAHADLVAADPTTGVSVTAIAARWGFAHPGRFAAAYRAHYGQAPSATLRT